MVTWKGADDCRVKVIRQDQREETVFNPDHPNGVGGVIRRPGYRVELLGTPSSLRDLAHRMGDDTGLVEVTLSEESGSVRVRRAQEGPVSVVLDNADDVVLDGSAFVVLDELARLTLEGTEPGLARIALHLRTLADNAEGRSNAPRRVALDHLGGRADWISVESVPLTLAAAWPFTLPGGLGGGMRLGRLDRGYVADRGDYQVEFVYKELCIYWEGDCGCLFQCGWGGSPWVTYVPAVEVWDDQVPGWMRGRRRQVLERLSANPKHILKTDRRDGSATEMVDERGHVHAVV